MTLTKNFTLEELTRSATARKQGIDNTATDPLIRSALLHLAVNILQPLRNAIGKPLKINSGYRCPDLNKAVGGVPTSQHTKGEAADVAAADPLALAQQAKDMELPFDQMIIYPTFVHFSHKRNGQQRGQILYNRRWTGGRLK